LYLVSFFGQIPKWWIWVYWWSFFRYSYPALMVNEFLGAKFSCESANATNCVTTGEEVLKNFAIPAEADLVWHWIVVLLGFTVAYRILTFLAFKFIQKEKR
jgi:ABC-type multidrug transport system permease subunit